MKTSEGTIVLSLMTLCISIWLLYGSLMLLHGLSTNPEFIASFDAIHVNSGKVYYKFSAYLMPIWLTVMAICCIYVLYGNKTSAFVIVIISALMLSDEIITQVMDDQWLHQAFRVPHITPILYVFNIMFFSWKLHKNNLQAP